MSSEITFSPAVPADHAAIAALLSGAELPSEDFAAHLEHFIVARTERDGIVGAIGAEVYGPEALLRSFVVAPQHRGEGIGQRLIDRLEHSANGWGVTRWWLLTTTAEKYFAARGFQVTPRSAAPAAIGQTEEFRSLCPSATCLSRKRRDP